VQGAQAAAGRRATPWLLALAVFAIALAATVVSPLIDGLANPGSAQPGVITFLGVGLSVLALTVYLLYSGLRQVLPKSGVFLFSAAGYSSLLIAVKFVVAPLALYEYSNASGLAFLGSDTGGFGYLGFPLVTCILAAIYATAFFLLYAYFQSRLRVRLGIPVGFEARFVVLYVTMFVLGVMATVSLGFGILATFDYLASLTFSFGLGLLLALALLGALVLCTAAFREANEQAVALRNMTVLTGFAWVGLAFIAAYHVLWLVFVLVIITIWPLKSVSFK
jgi:hypothetical protein